MIYTTNLIESVNARLRKVTRNRGQFPTEQAALKGLYLAVRNLEDYRSPNTGIRSSGWKQALRSRFTSRDESRHHDNRHDHLHRRSDAPELRRGVRQMWLTGCISARGRALRSGDGMTIPRQAC